MLLYKYKFSDQKQVTVPQAAQRVFGGVKKMRIGHGEWVCEKQGEM